MQGKRNFYGIEGYKRVSILKIEIRNAWYNFNKLIIKMDGLSALVWSKKTFSELELNWDGSSSSRDEFSFSIKFPIQVHPVSVTHVELHPSPFIFSIYFINYIRILWIWRSLKKKQSVVKRCQQIKQNQSQHI